MARQQQIISSESLLESRAHESVSSARLGEHSEVDPEEAEIDDEGPKDEATSASQEVRVEVILLKN